MSDNHSLDDKDDIDRLISFLQFVNSDILDIKSIRKDLKNAKKDYDNDCKEED